MRAISVPPWPAGRGHVSFGSAGAVGGRNHHVCVCLLLCDLFGRLLSALAETRVWNFAAARHDRTTIAQTGFPGKCGDWGRIIDLRHRWWAIAGEAVSDGRLQPAWCTAACVSCAMARPATNGGGVLAAVSVDFALYNASAWFTPID
ncbi:hypothetical protein D3C76_1157560 [compost metagenome]